MLGTPIRRCSPPDHPLAGCRQMRMSVGDSQPLTTCHPLRSTDLVNMAATLDSSIGESLGTVSFSGLEENADALLGVFKDVLTEPEFQNDKVEQAREQVRASIARGNEDPAFVLRREFSDAVYGKDSPYGWPLEYAGVDRITRGDMQSFYKRYYFPKNTMVVVWGDFDAAQMRAKIEKLFAGWTAVEAPVGDFPRSE